MAISLKNLRRKFAHVVCPRYIEEVDERVNQRVAQVLAQMDPFEPLLKHFHGVFSGEFTRSEENLDERSALQLMMLGYRLKNDISFKYLTEWIMNSQGNAMIRAPARTNDERGEILLWGKAQIASMILFVKEVGRLSLLYEDILEKQKGNDFNSDTNTVE